MARAITRDPREYRRGMVLGLTLAETMLLLLFLLMMAAAALLWRASEEARGARHDRDAAAARVADAEGRVRAIEAELRPYLERLRSHGVDATSIPELVDRLERARAVESERDALREALARAEEAARTARAERQRAEREPGPHRNGSREWQQAALSETLAEARRLDPSRPPDQVLSGLVGVLARQPEAGQPGATDALSDRLVRAGQAEARAAEADRRLAAAEQQLAALQAEVDRLRGALARQGGAGEVYPSCWSSAGRPEYLFEVVLRNGGEVEVNDLAPDGRRAQEPWTRLGQFPRGEPVRIERFLDAVRGLAEWSAQQRPECRFHIRVRNGLRPGSPMEEYNRVIGPLGNASSRHLPFYRVGG